MAEYKLKMTQDEKTTVQNALIIMRYSSAVDEILAEKLDALIAQLAYDSNAVRSHGVSRVSGFASLFKYSKRSRIAPGCLTSGSQFGHTAPPAPAAVLSAEMHLKKNCCKTVRQGL